MISVLTGDVVNSSKHAPEDWLPLLKTALNYLAPGRSEVFRGDSFQLEVRPEDAFLSAAYIKAAIRTIKNLDVRIAIGVGEKQFEGNRIAEDNGEAFVFSGETFETLKKDRVNLAIKTRWPSFDAEMNVIFRLTLIAMDTWPPATAATVKLSLENDTLSQKELALQAGIKQSSVSEALKRANLPLLLDTNELYIIKLNKLIHSDGYPAD